MTTTATDPGTETSAASFDVYRIRKDFPLLQRRARGGKPLVYLDNAATAQKPQVVLDAINRFYGEYNSNIHRGVHQLSVEATQAYEQARVKAQRFIGAARAEEIVFTRSVTEAINLVAQTYGRMHLGKGDEVIISEMEHHSNIVPWQLLCEQTGASLKVIPIDDAGELRMEEYAKLLCGRTKFVAITHVSNALGTINPVTEIIDLAHAQNAAVLIDGAQAVQHLHVHVDELGADFYAFTGHKLFGPTGTGVLYGKRDMLENMPPYQGGGEMIKSVTFEKTIYNDVPYKFEAGTPNIAGVIGLAAAIDYVTQIGLDRIASYEDGLLRYATDALSDVPQVRLIGTAQSKAAILSFVVEGVHAHDVGTILDEDGIAIRTGHHCAQPVMQHFGVPATCRASLALYNTKQEIDALVAGVRKVLEVFSV